MQNPAQTMVWRGWHGQSRSTATDRPLELGRRLRSTLGDYFDGLAHFSEVVTQLGRPKLNACDEFDVLHRSGSTD